VGSEWKLKTLITQRFSASLCPCSMWCKGPRSSLMGHEFPLCDRVYFHCVATRSLVYRLLRMSLCRKVWARLEVLEAMLPKIPSGEMLRRLYQSTLRNIPEYPFLQGCCAVLYLSRRQRVILEILKCLKSHVRIRNPAFGVGRMDCFLFVFVAV